MNPISCIITDDEPMARKGLQGYVARTPFLSLAGVCENITAMETMLRQQRADLLFLDIEMPGLSGIDFLKTATDPPAVIFTTAYEKYAMDGFELGVLDYLLKPVSFDRFSKACDKARDYFRLTSRSQDPGYFFVKAGQKLEKCVFSEILFVEAMENYVRIVGADKKLLVHATLKSIAEQLPGDRFMAVHKSFLVQLERVEAVEGSLLHIGGNTVPVSKALKEAVMERLLRRTGWPPRRE